MLPIATTSYTIKQGDVLGFRMFSHNAAGALSLGFTDTSNSDWYCGLDQNGDCLHQESTSDQWVNRVASLNGPMVGKTISLAVLEDNYGPAGQFSVMLSDMTITSVDGTVTVLLGPNAPSSSAASNTYYCASVNSATPWPVTCSTGPVPGTAGVDMGASLATYFMLGDHLGTAQMEFSAGGWPVWHGQFMPYGGELDAQTTGNHYKFTGKERDTESGLDYFGARYYGSNMGRWMSPDWADKPEAVPYSDLANPQSLNLYGYVNNNPLSKADPDGHCPTCMVWAEQVLTEAEESTAGQSVVNAIGATVTAGFAIGSGLASDILSNARPPTYVPGGSLTDSNGNSIFSTKNAAANAPSATGDKANTGPKAADAPGVTAGGQATDKYGNKVGPSGKNQVDQVDHSGKKGAKDAARQDGKGAPEKHPSPTKGDPHYHPTDADGDKQPNSTHHNYPN